MLNWFRERRAMRVEIEAVKAVLQETRLTMDILVLVMATAPKTDPANWFDGNAEALLLRGFEGFDADYVPRVREAREAAAATLHDIAKGIRSGASMAELAAMPRHGGVQ